MRNVIVVANRTATSEELLAALRERAEREPTRFTLVVPGTPHDDVGVPCEQRLAEALEHLRSAGLDATGLVGAADPAVAVKQVWDASQFDEIVVSTLPLSTSKWLPAGLPDRVRLVTGATVTHVVSQPVASPLFN